MCLCHKRLVRIRKCLEKILVLFLAVDEPYGELRDPREGSYALSFSRCGLERGRSGEPPSALSLHERYVCARISLHRIAHLGALGAYRGGSCAYEPEITAEESHRPVRFARLAISQYERLGLVFLVHDLFVEFDDGARCFLYFSKMLLYHRPILRRRRELVSGGFSRLHVLRFPVCLYLADGVPDETFFLQLLRDIRIERDAVTRPLHFFHIHLVSNDGKIFI